jgi:hypothetical protein
MTDAMTGADRSQWPIVVGGCHRSGTSLVRRLLDTHSRIHCGPELKFFRDFYGDYSDDTYAHLRFSTTARALVPEDEERLGVLGTAFLALHELAAGRAAKPRWADKAPENVLYTAEWERLLGSRWLLLHCVRNPLDTVASMREAGFSLSLPVDLPGLVEWYRRYTSAGLRFGELYPDRYVQVVYEELVRAPWVVLERTMNLLGESAEPRQLDFNSVAHQPGLEDPKIARSERIRTDSVDRWREALSDGETATIWTQAGDLWSSIDPHLAVWSPPYVSG